VTPVRECAAVGPVRSTLFASAGTAAPGVYDSEGIHTAADSGGERGVAAFSAAELVKIARARSGSGDRLAPLTAKT